MRLRALKQTCLAVTQVIAVIVCLSSALRAEAPKPTPTPSPAPTAPGQASFSQALADMASCASDLLPVIRKEIEGPLLPWLEKLSMFLAGVVAIAAFARLWRENAGAGADLFWWFARLGVIFALIGSGPKIIDGMFLTGREIAVGEDGQGALFQLYVKQRGNFDTAYRVFQEGLFTVKYVPVQPTPGGVLGRLGVLFSTESSAEDPVRKLDTISMDMRLVFDSLNFSRAVITFGDFFLTMLGGFLMIVMRLAAPVMIALAIDRNLAQRVTYPYVWGAVVLTLIWPIVSILIRAIAYMGGNVAMALGDKQLFYQFDDRTMQIIHNSGSHPFYTALFGAVIMLIAGLSLWGAPYIALQLSSGRVYEGVSTTVSSWVGQVMGAGIEYYSAGTAARITRQAETLQAEGGYAAEVVRAGAAKDSEDLRARASKIIGDTGAKGSLAASLAGIEAGRVQQVLGAEADNKYNRTAVEAQRALAISDQNALWDRALAETEVARAADTQHWKGQKILSGANWGGDTIRASMRERNEQTGMKEDTTRGVLIGEAVRVGGSAWGFREEYMAIQNRAAGNRAAVDNYFNKTNENQRLYARVMAGANDARLTDLKTAASAGADIASKGARDNYGITVGGYNTAYGLSLRANEINLRGSLDSAKAVRDAAVDAARLRSIASIINAVGHNVARDIEQGLTLRY